MVLSGIGWSFICLCVVLLAVVVMCMCCVCMVDEMLNPRMYGPCGGDSLGWFAMAILRGGVGRLRWGWMSMDEWVHDMFRG